MLAFLFLALVSLASPLYALRCNGGMYYYTPNVTMDYWTNLYGAYFAESEDDWSAPACYCVSREYYKADTYVFSAMQCGVKQYLFAN